MKLLLLAFTFREKFLPFLPLRPEFIVFFQIKNILAPGVADPHGTWHDCKLNVKKCSPNQIKTMQGE